jgi:hypothetical protein
MTHARQMGKTNARVQILDKENRTKYLPFEIFMV